MTAVSARTPARQVAAVPAAPPLPRRTRHSAACWTEYRRLRAVGVSAHIAGVLAAGPPWRDDTEAAYRRQLAMGLPTTSTARAAHAAARKQRRQRHGT